jgi:hypothetical protein
MINPLIFGIFGAAAVLVAYLAELFGRVTPENRLFMLANLIGSIFLFIYALMLGSIVFMVMNSVWALGSLYELVKSR